MRSLDIKKQVKEAELPDEEFEIIDDAGEVSDDYFKRIDIPDTRKIDMASGFPMTDTNKLSRQANFGVAKDIVRVAKSKGIDPYTALALSFQETGIGSDFDEDAGEFTDGNPFRVRGDQFPGIPHEDRIENALDILTEKFRIAKSRGKTEEADVIQAWNGYGKVGKYTEGKQQKMYGIDVSKEPIDMNKNPVYGKRILDIRENILKKHPEIVKLVEGGKSESGTVNPKWKGYRSVKGTKSGKNYVWTGKDQFDPQGYYYEL